MLLSKKAKEKFVTVPSGNKNQVTVVVCVNATGNAMPPYVILHAKNLNIDWTLGEMPGTSYGLSNNGWNCFDCGSPNTF